MSDKVETNVITVREAGAKALIPFIVFVLFYFGFSLLTRDFSKVPMTVAFIISSAVGLILNHKEKLIYCKTPNQIYYI